MGREIRKVPPNWEHPKYTSNDAPFSNRVGGYKPMYNRTFAVAASEWKEGFAAWERGERPDYCTDESRALEFWEWDAAPPDREYYRPYKDDDATWFQVFETVSEGTPVTPPFATREELVEYLIRHGDFWQQKRWRDGDTFMQPEPPGYSRSNAESFVLGDGYAPSMIVIHSASGNQVLHGINAAAALRT
jgi:hypothetical protein